MSYLLQPNSFITYPAFQIFAIPATAAMLAILASRYSAMGSIEAEDTLNLNKKLCGQIYLR
jgi:hypothetical protein